MTINELKRIKEEVNVTFRFSKSGVNQYYSVFVQNGNIIGDVPRILATYNKPIILPKDINLTELIDTIKKYSFSPKHFSIHLINGEIADLYTAKTLKQSIKNSEDKLANIFIDFLKTELLEDLSKCNYVQIEGEPLGKEAKNKDKLLYILNCKSYEFLTALRLRKKESMTGECDYMHSTMYLDDVIRGTNLLSNWVR